MNHEITIPIDKAVELLNELDNYHPSKSGKSPSEELWHVFKMLIGNLIGENRIEDIERRGVLSSVDLFWLFETYRIHVALKILLMSLGHKKPALVTKQWIELAIRMLKTSTPKRMTPRRWQLDCGTSYGLDELEEQLAYMEFAQWDAVDTESKKVMWKLKFG